MPRFVSWALVCACRRSAPRSSSMVSATPKPSSVSTILSGISLAIVTHAIVLPKRSLPDISRVTSFPKINSLTRSLARLDRYPSGYSGASSPSSRTRVPSFVSNVSPSTILVTNNRVDYRLLLRRIKEAAPDDVRTSDAAISPTITLPMAFQSCSPTSIILYLPVENLIRLQLQKTLDSCNGKG